MPPLIMLDRLSELSGRMTSPVESEPESHHNRGISGTTPIYDDDTSLALDGLDVASGPRSQFNGQRVAASPTPSSLILKSPPPTTTDTHYIESPSINLLIASADEPLHDMAKNKYRVEEIVGGTIDGVVFIVLSIVLFFLYQRRRARARNPSPYVMGPLQASLPMSKEAFTSPRYSHYGLSFSASAPPSTDSLTPVPHKSHESRRNLSDHVIASSWHGV
ncbi:hypothetical protein FPV67DRAFT_1665685 [Lyophyllum atratum]|nr:hypothetical protein FPV67DRAFT_1665685 [Lyophyllum atratum]